MQCLRKYQGHKCVRNLMMSKPHAVHHCLCQAQWMTHHVFAPVEPDEIHCWCVREADDQIHDMERAKLFIEQDAVKAIEDMAEFEWPSSEEEAKRAHPSNQEDDT